MLAELWHSIEKNKVQCDLCSHHCVISSGKVGFCGVRINKNGTMHTLVADNVAAVNLDPVEKKPLYHFLPGTKTYSLGTEGCNMGCLFCQNHTLSQNPKKTGKVHGKLISPKRLVNNALEANAASISFTYSEPTVFFELMYETAQMAQVNGLKNILVSNGYQSRQCLEVLYRFINAANIDLKSFSDGFYKKYCKASLQPVLDTLKVIKSMGWWLEVTTLIIPDVNDTREELQEIASFICTELGPEVPWHLSRFNPAYHLFNVESTPLSALMEAKEIGEAQGLKHVYIGNVPPAAYSCTFCPKCEKLCVNRGAYGIKSKLVAGVCPHCDYKLAGVW